MKLALATERSFCRLVLRPLSGGAAVLVILLGFLSSSELFAADETEPVSAALTEDELVEKDPLVRRLVEEGGETTAALFLQGVIQDGEKRFQYTEFLKKVLDPAVLSGNSLQVEVATTLLKTMRDLVTTPAGSAISVHVEDHLINLIAVGPESLRVAVRGALLNFIQEEKKNVARGEKLTIVEKLGKKLVHNHPPSTDEIHEVSRILWHADGRSLVSFLVAGLVLNREKATEDPTQVSGYIIELRRLLLLDLSSVGQWESWWKEHEGESIETILANSQRVYVKRRVELWRSNLQRLRELADPPAYFKTLEETFAKDAVEEPRIAVLAELAEFPIWLQESRFDPDEFDGTAQENLLRAGVEFVLEILEGHGAYTHESLAVRTVAMAALGAFHEVIGRGEARSEGTERAESVEEKLPSRRTNASEFRAKVVSVLLEDLQGSTPLTYSEWGRDELSYRLEFIRTVGLLGVSDAPVRDSLRGLLEGSEAAVTRDDFELLAAAVSSVGKILKGNEGIDPGQDVPAILRVYKLAREHDDPQKRKDKDPRHKLWRELRKACIAAVNLPVSDEETRKKIREVYAAILEPSEESMPERIPAVIGLGIFAEEDEPSRQVLIGVLRQHDNFEVSEVNAVVNALAYLNGKRALSCFVEFLVARDRPYAEQVWKRSLNILKRGSPQLRSWLMTELERFGFESDSTDFARVVVSLGQESGLQGLFSTDKVNFDAIEFLWQSALVEIRAYEILGQENDGLERLGRLESFWDKHEEVLEFRPGIRAELKVMRERLDEKQKFKAEAEKAPAPTAAELLPRLLEIVRLKDDALERWRAFAWVHGLLQELRPAAATADLASGVEKALTEEEGYWQGLSEESRKRYLKNLTEIQEKFQVTPSNQ